MVDRCVKMDNPNGMKTPKDGGQRGACTDLMANNMATNNAKEIVCSILLDHPLTLSTLAVCVPFQIQLNIPCVVSCWIPLLFSFSAETVARNLRMRLQFKSISYRTIICDAIRMIADEVEARAVSFVYAIFKLIACECVCQFPSFI